MGALMRQVDRLDVDGLRAGRAGNAWWLPCVLLFASAVATAGFSLEPRSGRPILAIFPPWWSNERGAGAAINAGGSLVGFGRWSGTVVAISDGPRFKKRLRANGAVLLLDARALAGCMHSSILEQG